MFLRDLEAYNISAAKTPYYFGHFLFEAKSSEDFAVAEYAPLPQRAHSVGIFRFWRDAGYAIGALLTGLLADAFGLGGALVVIGGLTVLSALVIQRRMYCLPVE